MTLRRVQIPTQNHYAGNHGQRLMVLHTTEGAQTIEDLGHYFQTGTNQASSHVGFDSTPGAIGEYVRRTDSAWTVADFNRVSRNGEFCTPSGAAANWTQADWLARPVMLDNAAQWLREEASQSGIPLVKLTPAQAQGNGRGVCQHSDLGILGGGHHDCGPGFPIDHVIALAKGEQPAPAQEDDPVICAFVNTFNGNTETFEVNPKGGLYLRSRNKDTGQWSAARFLADGFTGSASVAIRSNGIDVFVELAAGGVIAYVFDPAHPGWTRQSLTAGVS